ncbi:MAG: hypothetical protein ACP5H7_01120 [Minisyncoccia bacterium]
MSKKIVSLAIIFLLVSLNIFVVGIPILSRAEDENPKECCKIRVTFTIKQPDGSDLQIQKGNCAAPSGEAAQQCSCQGIIYGLTTPGIWSVICILNSLYLVTKWLFYILTTISVFIILIGAFLIMASGGDPKKWKKGRDVIFYALIGLGVALLSKVFPSLVKYFLGV